MVEDNHDIEVNGLWDTNTKRGLQVFLHQQAGIFGRGKENELLGMGFLSSFVCIACSLGNPVYPNSPFVSSV